MSPVDSPHKGPVMRYFNIYLFSPVSEQYNRDAGDHKHDTRRSYDVTVMHYSDVIMNAMASQIIGALFTQPFLQARIKENTKAPRHWLLWGEFTGDRWIPAQRASNAGNGSIWWRHYGNDCPFLTAGLQSSPRILITLTVSFIAVYSVRTMHSKAGVNPLVPGKFQWNFR